MSVNEEQLDLSDELTVFVSTVGAPSFEACLAHLDSQDCSFNQEIIDHVAPLSAALQQMLDRCATPYYVQVDEDMLLFPHAVRTLYEQISTAPDDVAIVVRLLYDVHLERCLTGVKAYRHRIVRNYPYENVEGCEWDQWHRISEEGYRCTRSRPENATRDSPETLGLHGTYWTPRAIYERFATFERKRCRGNRTHDWVLAYPQIFLDRFLETGSKLDLFALMGFISGRLASHRGAGREKDFRRYDRLPGFSSLCAFLEQVSSEDPEIGW